VIESPASDNEPRDEHRTGETQQSPGEDFDPAAYLPCEALVGVAVVELLI
jgi:hypothetical protein